MATVKGVNLIQVDSGGINITTLNNSDVQINSNNLARWSVGGTTGQLTQLANGGAINFNVSDSGILYSNAGGSLKITTTTNTAILFAINNTDTIRFDGAGTSYRLTDSQIRTDTSDGTDNKSISVAGGGGVATTRGGWIRVFGNEFSGSAGQVQIVTGDISAAPLLLHASNSSGTVSFRVGGTDISNIDANGYVGVITNNYIRTNTTDGTDNKALFICGAGSNAANRGAYIRLFGNEYNTAQGQVDINTGDANSGNCIVRILSNSTNASAGIYFAVNTGSGAITAWSIVQSGILYGNFTDNKIFSTANTGRMAVAGGSADSQNNGGYLDLRGNSYAGGSQGLAALVSGDTSSAPVLLHAYQAAAQIIFRINTTNRWTIDTTALLPSANNTYNVGSTAFRVATFFAVNALNTSDMRLKTDIVTLNKVDALTKVNALNPVNYKLISEYDTSDRLRSGFLAQEAATVIPEAVVAGDPDLELAYGDEGFESWSMQTDHVIPYLTAAIQQLSVLVEDLTTRIATIEEML